MKISYFGHSCFLLESKGYTLALDPYAPTVPGYPVLSVEANAAHASHDHDDHNYYEAVRIVDSGSENPYRIKEVIVPHDEKGGALRGMNKITIIEAEGKKIIHMGDIGCDLTSEQAEILKNADVIMIPIGGFFTIDCEKANEIILNLNPKLAIPMHYRKGKFDYELIEDISSCKLAPVFKEMAYGESLNL